MTTAGVLDTRHQVFVSSTYLDLVDERRAVIQALLELDCIPAGMEMFPAANEDQWSLIKEVIELSDYYVVIVGGRYGSVTAEGLSYTEKEYDFAVECGIPVLGFVHSDPNSIPAGMSELDAEARERLEAFREKVKERMVKTYTTPDELASVVSRGLVRTIKRNPRPGWVRGDNAMTDKTRTEIAELRAALAESERDRIQGQEAVESTEIDDSFAHGDDEQTLRFDATYGPGWNESVETVSIPYAWDEIVGALGHAMLDEAPEPELRRLISEQAYRDLIAIEDGSWKDQERLKLAILDESWGTVVVQLRALGLITTGSKKRTVSDRSVYWQLTPAGDAYLVRLTAIKRPSITAEDVL